MRMVGRRKSERHLAPRLYVKRGRRVDTYWTLLGGKYHGLGNDRAEAERQLRDLIEGRPVSGSIADLAARFIKHMQGERDRGVKTALAQRTIDDYIEALNKHLLPVFGKMRPGDFLPTHASQYLARMAEKGRAVRANREIAAFGSMFDYGMRIGVVVANPCRGVKRNPEIPRDRGVTIAEMNALIAKAKARGVGSYMVALIGVMVAITGRRRVEIRRLMLTSITPEGIVGEESKAKRGRRGRAFLVQWSPTLREVVEEARALKRPATSIYLFASRTGGPYSDSGFKTTWNRIMSDYVEAGGEHFTAHDLRALFVSKKLDRGEDPQTHANPATTHRVYDRRRVVKVRAL
ncbi:MAG: tyrosine-type recombinase/integrase [Burkholderiales bacterium]|nr:tyrosine-type recombinase/integrase [Burkholderiales bacterium]